MQSIFYVVASIALAIWISNGLFHAARDDTDSDDKSGMFLYTDHKTGVQYVGTLYGGLTPRLDKDGKIVTK